MKPQTTGFAASSLVHVFAALLLYGLATALPESRPPVVIDLSLLAPPAAGPMVEPAAPPVVQEAEPPPPPPVAEEKVMPREIAPVKRAKKIVRKVEPDPQAVQIPDPDPVVAEEPPVQPETEPLPVPAASQPPRPQAVTPRAVAAGPAVPQKPTASGMAGENLNAEERWRQEHFAFIKEAIRRNMTYPAVARRNGWQGRVLVSFVICQDGRVEDVRVEQSSGFALLDRNAITTIKETAPFPLPPVRATLIVPIDYVLG